MARQTIIILGAGSAGLHCALALAEKSKPSHLRIVLVDKNPSHLVHGSLYRGLTPGDEAISFPINSIIAGHGIEFRQELVVEIDSSKRAVILHESGALSYDYLVVALGATADQSKLLGVSDHAFVFRTLTDMTRLRKALAHRALNKMPTNLVIAGAGSTGVELAGQLLSETNKKLGLQVNIIEQVGHILSGLPYALSNKIADHLVHQGANLYCAEAIKSVTAKSVGLVGGRTISYDLIVWTGGVKASPLIKRAGFEVDQQGRGVVTRSLQAHGFTRVYIVGDSASFTHGRRQVLPMMNAHACNGGVAVAHNILRQLKDRPPKPFRPSASPIVICLGEQIGYVHFGPLSLSGHWVIKLRTWLELWYLSGLLPWRTAQVVEQKSRPA